MTESFRDELIETIFTLSRLMRERMSFNTELMSLSLLQLQTLIFLKKNDCSQMKQIAEHLKIELPSATSLINKLAVTKLISRKTDKTDRRIVQIQLTKKGVELLQKALESRSKKLKETLAFLSKDDRKDLLRISKSLVLKMEEQYEQ